MLVAKINIILYDKLIASKLIMSGLRCSMIIDKSPHICQIETFDGNDIPVNTHISVKATVISGEISLLAFNKGTRITLFKGEEIGWGSIEEIKELYLEKENLEVIEDKKKLDDIINCAENLSCALICEDVYSLVREHNK